MSGTGDDRDWMPLPVSACWYCAKQTNAAADSQNREVRPVEGSISVCLYCGAVAVFDRALMLRAPTGAELDAMAGDAKVMLVIASLQWQRQYVISESGGGMIHADKN